MGHLGLSHESCSTIQLKFVAGAAFSLLTQQNPRLCLSAICLKLEESSCQQACLGFCQAKPHG